MAKAKKKSKAKPQAPQSSPSTEKPVPVSSNNIYDTIAAALVSANQPVLLKLCRLCGTKDGPFLNIFDPEQITAQKIDQLMPFKIAENDELPHKICFRCSAKVEELYEFVQKCIKTQEVQASTLSKKTPIAFKTKTRSIWEDKLNKSNMSNDDICNALIKKAMAGIKDIPLNELPEEVTKAPDLVEATKLETRDKSSTPIPTVSIEDKDDESIQSLKQAKLKLDKCDQVKITRTSRSSKSSEPILTGLEDIHKDKRPQKTTEKSIKKCEEIIKTEAPKVKQEVKQKLKQEVITKNETESVSKPIRKDCLSFDYDDGPYYNNDKKDEEKKEIPKKVEEVVKKDSKPFNIMDHVCIIKVNGVGVLFQCKLCNRNFLKKEVVVSHSCAKNGVPKADIFNKMPLPEIPKIPTVKYINTKVAEKKNDVPPTPTPEPTPEPPLKPKPRIGPASRVKRDNNVNVKPAQPTPSIPVIPPDAPKVVPAGNILPSMNGRFRLVPGPGNTFSLVEDQALIEIDIPPPESNTKPSRKRKSNDLPSASRTTQNNKKQDVINVDDEPKTKDSHQPYPVGLFQTPVAQPAAFTTPAMKKQSYTIVQTGNPSKLLISTKPQPQVEEPSKKKVKKAKSQHKAEVAGSKEPFSVTIEDTTHPKDSGFFTFINVDPLLQPSYVLPTNNIIQESQISTSTAAQSATEKDKDKYSCNMCNESFTREKKLLAHIQSHYSKMDEEDQLRAEKSDRKKQKRL